MFRIRRCSGCSASTPRQDTLAFQIDLWSSAAKSPRNLIESELRQKEIHFSSRTRAATDRIQASTAAAPCSRNTSRASSPTTCGRLPQAESSRRRRRMKRSTIFSISFITRTITKAPRKITNFRGATMEEHWQSGYNDAVRTLRHPEVLQRPENMTVCSPSTSRATDANNGVPDRG